jgi:hypothetical protein
LPFAFIDRTLRRREHLAGEMAESLARRTIVIVVCAWWSREQSFLCHGVSMVPTDQHVASAAVSSLDVMRFPNAEAAVMAKRAK